MEAEVSSATPQIPQGSTSSVTVIAMTLQQLNDAEIQRLIPAIAYLAILIVTGIVGNGLVCYVYRTKYQLSNSNYFILCLSTINLFSCCIAMPLEIATILDQYTFKYLWLCKLSRFFNALGTVSESFLLLFIAFNRYRKVCRPFGWQIKANVAKFLSVFSVLLGLLFSWPAIFIYGKQTYPILEYGLLGNECSTDDEMLKTIFPLINTAAFGGLFVFGIIYICIMYYFIGREVMKHAKRMPNELSVCNTSVPISSTKDGRDSRISGELDPNLLAKYNRIKENTESQQKNMDCSIKDTSAVLKEQEEEGEDDTQSDDNVIKSDQMNKDKNGEDSNKPDGLGREVIDIDIYYAGNRSIIGRIENNGDRDIQKNISRLEPENEDEICVDEAHSSINEIEEGKEITSELSIVEMSGKRADLSESFECEKPKTLLSRMPSTRILDTNAVVRPMKSLESSSGLNSGLKTQNLKQARARKTSFVMFLTSLAFVLSYLPHLVLVILKLLNNNISKNISDNGRAVYYMFLRSYFLNCAINPVIYGAFDTRFRSACKEIFARCCRRKD